MQGFNIISAQSYEAVPPQTYPELVFSIAVYPIQIYAASYILGTINNYLARTLPPAHAPLRHMHCVALAVPMAVLLPSITCSPAVGQVKKDPRTEADRKLLQSVEEYSSQRRLPMGLKNRLRRYFEFQQRKQRNDDAALQTMLPRSMQLKLALVLHNDVLTRNGKLFAGCNPYFMAQFLAQLQEVHLMPGEMLVEQFESSTNLARAPAPPRAPASAGEPPRALIAYPLAQLSASSGSAVRGDFVQGFCLEKPSGIRQPVARCHPAAYLPCSEQGARRRLRCSAWPARCLS